MEWTTLLPGLSEIENAARLIYRSMPADAAVQLAVDQCPCWCRGLGEAREPYAGRGVQGSRRTGLHGLAAAGAAGGTERWSRQRVGTMGSRWPLQRLQYGIRVVIVVPFGNSIEKNRAMRALGAELVEYGEDFQEASEHAELLRTREWVASRAELRPSAGDRRGDVCAGVVYSVSAHWTRSMCRSGWALVCAERLRRARRWGWRRRWLGWFRAHAPAYALSFAAGERMEHEAMYGDRGWSGVPKAGYRCAGDTDGRNGSNRHGR